MCACVCVCVRVRVWVGCMRVPGLARTPDVWRHVGGCVKGKGITTRDKTRAKTYIDERACDRDGLAFLLYLSYNVMAEWRESELKAPSTIHSVCLASQLPAASSSLHTHRVYIYLKPPLYLKPPRQVRHVFALCIDVHTHTHTHKRTQTHTHTHTHANTHTQDTVPETATTSPPHPCTLRRHTAGRPHRRSSAAGGGPGN